MTLIVIPTFSNRWVKKSPSSPKTTRLENGSLARRAMRSRIRKNVMKSTSAAITPMKPSSSPPQKKSNGGFRPGKNRDPLLGSVEEAVPDPPARADGHLRLDRLVAGVD